MKAKRTVGWTVGIGVGMMVALGLVLLFLLTQATGNQAMYEQNYSVLFALNVAVAGLLLLAIGWMGFRLLMRRRQERFGSRLLVKLAAIFALVGLLPGTMIYVVSYQFVSRSIESWFDVKVEGALVAGLNLGRATLDALSSDLTNKVKQSAQQIADTPDTGMALALERERQELNATDIALWSSSGQIIASTGQSRFLLKPDSPSAQQLRQVRAQQVVTQIEGLDEAGESNGQARIKVLALVQPTKFKLFGDVKFLQVTEALPSSLVANAIAVQEANREYQERALARVGLRKMYIGTLTLSLFLAVFGAVLLAVVLGNQLARPLLVLAHGVKQVARGDLTPKAALHGNDELDGLTRSFADMTQQLADARQAVQVSISQVDSARANLQTILDNLTAGVLVLDAKGRIQSCNPGATRILRAPLAAYYGQALQDVPGLQAFGKDVQDQFDAYFSNQAEARGLEHWQQSFELNTADAGMPENVTTLIARGAPMPGHECLLVLDDVSEMVSAQRAQAWGEVARRLAHEIKNPLTPIRLSAERLEMKLEGKLVEPERALLAKSVKTIVDQVDALKRLVNEFRDYARLPTAELKPVDLNNLIEDIMHLYASDNAVVPVHVELDSHCPAIQGDEQQLRQVIHNLLQNAQDAVALLPNPSVIVKTEYVAAIKRVRLSVTDNGGGFPEHILKRAFEPYITTKSKGTGLGLAVVKKIADEHGARIDISNLVTQGLAQGAQVSLSLAVIS